MSVLNGRAWVDLNDPDVEWITEHLWFHCPNCLQKFQIKDMVIKAKERELICRFCESKEEHENNEDDEPGFEM